MSEEELSKIFDNIDFNKDGEINYSEFLAATIKKEKVISESNMKLAFHHFDTDNSGFITPDNLLAAFKRQGKTNFTPEDVKKMIDDI
jgi:calcium-dependent protein kinase